MPSDDRYEPEIRGLEVAIGLQLDVIGGSLGEPRAGRDDDAYRRVLHARYRETQTMRDSFNEHTARGYAMRLRDEAERTRALVAALDAGPGEGAGARTAVVLEARALVDALEAGAWTLEWLALCITAERKVPR